MNKAFLALLALVLSCGCGPVRTLAPPEGPVNTSLLRYRFSPGDDLCYFLRSSVWSQSLGESPAALSVDQEVEFRRKVLEVLPGGRARLSVAIDRLRLAMQAPGQEDTVFDSDDPESARQCPPEMQGIAFLVGKEIRVEQMPSGEVTGVSGLTPIYTEALARLSPNERQPAERLLRETAQKPTGMLGLDVIFPAVPLAPGKSWWAERGPFPIFSGRTAYPCQYLLKEVSGGQAIVEFSGQLRASDNQNDLKMHRVRTVTVQGSFSFDLKKGFLTEMQGESSSFLRVEGNEQLRTRTTWELKLRNK